MSDEQIEALTGLIETYVAAHQERLELFDGDTRRVTASHPVKDEYTAVLNFVQMLPICVERYSLKMSEALADDTLQRALDRTESPGTAALDLAEVLNHPLVTKLYIPIDGVSIDAAEYQIGAVKLIRMDEAAHERLIIRPFAEMMTRNPRYDDGQKAAFIERHANEKGLIGSRVRGDFDPRRDRKNIRSC